MRGSNGLRRLRLRRDTIQIEPPISLPAPSSSAAPVIDARAPLPPLKGVEEKKPAASSEKPVLGFADNIPLSVALRQVLPQEIGFSVAKDVSLGTLVSWKGETPWRGDEVDADPRWLGF